MKLAKLAALLVMALGCGASFGQWLWLDASGRKVYSDRPPPAEIPERNILRRPGEMRAAPAPVVGAESAASGAVKAATPAPARTAEDPLEKKKKEAEAAELAKKRAEEEKAQQVKAENCQRAKSAKLALTSGMRIARVNDKGEREVLDDAARAAELKRIEAAIAANCQ